MKTIRAKFLLTAFVAALIAAPAFAVTTPVGTITQVRPYSNGTVYISHSVGACGTSVFTVDTNTVGGKAMYAAALAALASQKQVSIELANVTCAWGMPIQSIYVNS